MLLAEAFPGSDIPAPEYLRWLHEASPVGPVIETNLDDERGRAGHHTLVPITLTRDGVDRRTSVSLSTAVHERVRPVTFTARCTSASY